MKLSRLASLTNNIYLTAYPTPWSVDHAAHAAGPTTRSIHVDNETILSEAYDPPFLTIRIVIEHSIIFVSF